MHPLTLIVFLPIIASIIAGLGGRWIGKTAAKVITTAALFVGMFLSWPIFIQYVAGDAQDTVVPVLDWIRSGTLTVEWALRLDALTAVMLVVVTTVSALVHLYSWGYMEEDPSQSRSFSYLSLFTFSKSYAMTGLRFGYMAVQDARLRERLFKLLFLTTSNVSSIIQYGAIGALKGSQAVIEQFRVELEARRKLFYDGIATAAPGVLGGRPPRGAFYAFLKIEEGASSGVRPSASSGRGEPVEPRSPESGVEASRSWAMSELLIKEGRIGCVPGVDFGMCGEGYVRFCFARERAELEGALASMRAVFAAGSP